MIKNIVPAGEELARLISQSKKMSEFDEMILSRARELLMMFDFYSNGHEWKNRVLIDDESAQPDAVMLGMVCLLPGMEDVQLKFVRTCENCNEKYNTGNNGGKYCPECRRKWYNRYNRIWRQNHPKKVGVLHTSSGNSKLQSKLEIQVIAWIQTQA